MRRLLAAALLLSACTTMNPPRTSIVDFWHQNEGECPAPLRELAFRADGTFSVTWLPFETYKDYWGTYRFNARTGQLDLTVTGGNRIPADGVRSGRAVISGETLTLEGVSFGSPENGAVCTAPFHRPNR